MASPILHIKDSYYFEVPKAFWRYNDMEQVPEWLKDAHKDATGHELTMGEVQDPVHGLDGKIMIPQPFGTLDNLYTPASGFCISKFMIIQVVVAALVAFLFIRVAKKIASGDAPKGRFVNMLEAMLLFIRDDVARPAIGHGADKFLPFLWTIFFFIVGLNLAGMIPWVGAPTGGPLTVTLVLAASTMIMVFVAGNRELGAVGFWKNMVPSMGLPLVLGVVLIPMIFAIELLAFFIKHLVLAIRLLANMFAGHVVLLSIMYLAFSAETAGSEMWAFIAPISVLSAAVFSCLELFVAFLQAFIFTFLSALFIGLATHEH